MRRFPGEPRGPGFVRLLLLSLVVGNAADTSGSTTQKEPGPETTRATTNAPPGAPPLPPSESDPSEPSSFRCDAISILGNGHDVTLHRCTGGTCYATDIISACGCRSCKVLVIGACNPAVWPIGPFPPIPLHRMLVPAISHSDADTRWATAAGTAGHRWEHRCSGLIWALAPWSTFNPGTALASLSP